MKDQVPYDRTDAV